MPALALARGLRVIRRAANVLPIPVLEPVGLIAGDLARPVVGPQPGLMNDRRPLAARGLERQLQRRGDVLGLHGRTPLPGDDGPGILVEEGRHIEPAPPHHLEIREVGLPQRVRSDRLIAELVGGLDGYQGRTGQSRHGP